MIHDLALAVRKNLKARGFPYPVYPDPRLLEHGNTSNAIVFGRDRESGDIITPPMGAKDRNPDVRFNRGVGGVVWVFASSSADGATEGDHNDECDHVCDGVLTSIEEILLTKRLPLEIIDSRMLRPEDLPYEALRSWPGAVARIRFRVRTAVPKTKYNGSAQAEGVVFDASNTYTPKVEGTPNP